MRRGGEALTAAAFSAGRATTVDVRGLDGPACQPPPRRLDPWIR